MLKKINLFILSALLIVNSYGCVALLVGAAAGTGTAVWLSGKLTQQFNAPYEHTRAAAKIALDSLHLNIAKESHTDTVTQLKGDYTDGSEFWVDVRKVTEKATKVEVRVGGLGPNKEASTKILKAIEANL